MTTAARATATKPLLKEFGKAKRDSLIPILQKAQEVHGFLRAQMKEIWGRDAAAAVRILYGGSAKPDNVAALLAKEDIDGGLVGGASLFPETFAWIVKFK